MQATPKKILDRIKGMGLGFFKNQRIHDDGISYDLLGFADAHNIISGEKLQQIYSKIEQMQKEQRQEIADLERQDMELEARISKEFIAKYGDKSNWNAWIWNEYYRELGFIGR